MYLLLKTVHVLAVVLFLGNIITGVFWKLHADRTRNPAIMANALQGVIHSDRWFTIPGVALIIITGVWMAMTAGYPILGTGWIFWGLVLFVVSGLIFQIWIAPLQRQMLALVQNGATMDWLAYKRLSRRWDISGAVATLTPLLAMCLMVFKPALLGLSG